MTFKKKKKDEQQKHIDLCNSKYSACFTVYTSISSSFLNIQQQLRLLQLSQPHQENLLFAGLLYFFLSLACLIGSHKCRLGKFHNKIN